VRGAGDPSRLKRSIGDPGDGVGPACQLGVGL
jgi:hypothetical protein